MSRFYRKNGKNKNLRPFDQIKSVIEKAEQTKDPMQLAHAALDIIDSLAPAEITPPLNNSLVQLIRGVSKYLRLPLINEKHDPYGFFVDLKKAQDSETPEKTFQNLRKLADMIVRFKKL